MLPKTNLCWVTTGLPHGPYNPTIISYLASVRYRISSPCSLLLERGYSVSILNPEEAEKPLVLPSGVNILAFSKLITSLDRFNHLAEQSLALAETAHQQGIPIVLDLCDNVFAMPFAEDFYLRLLEYVGTVTVNSVAMAQIVHQHMGRKSVIIEDPVEGTRGGANFAYAGSQRFARLLEIFGKRRPPLRLLWFGHESNLDTLADFLSQLPANLNIFTIELEVITSVNTGAEQLCEKYNSTHPGNLKLIFTPWSSDAVRIALSACHAVIIPSWPNNEGKAVKSANRLLESFWAGRFVIANPLPAYLEFGSFAWIGNNILEGIEWLTTHPKEIEARIHQAQAYIASHYTPSHIVEKWDNAFRAISNHNP